MPQPIISLRKVNVTNKSNKILSINKFEIHRGAAYLIHGKMGAGKTALINVLSRNIKINSGELEYENKPISSYSKRDFYDQVALVPQINKTPWGTVRKYLTKTLSKYSHIKNPATKIDEIGRKMEINHLLDIKMSKLSQGQLRWVIVAANIASDTKVLLIDELEQHLSRNDINILIKILYKKCNYDGITLIGTTQNKELFSQRLSSVTISLEEGRITSVRSSSKRSKGYDKRRKN